MSIVIDPDCEVREATDAEKQAAARREEIARETHAMHQAFIALQPLGFNARKRVLRWLADALPDIEVPF